MILSYERQYGALRTPEIPCEWQLVWEHGLEQEVLI